MYLIFVILKETGIHFLEQTMFHWKGLYSKIFPRPNSSGSQRNIVYDSVTSSYVPKAFVYSGERSLLGGASQSVE